MPSLLKCANYKVDLCRGDFLAFVPNVPREFPLMKRHLDDLNATTAAVRRLRDSVELWQGSKNKQCFDWMTRHFRDVEAEYRAMYNGIGRLADGLEGVWAEAENFLKSNGALDKSITAYKANYAGKRVSRLGDLEQAMREISVTGRCARDVGPSVLSGLGKQKLPGYDPRLVRQVAKDLRSLRSKLNRPA